MSYGPNGSNTPAQGHGGQGNPEGYPEHGDRPPHQAPGRAYGQQPPGGQGYPGHAYEGQAYEGGPQGAPAYGARPHGGPGHGQQPYGDQGTMHLRGVGQGPGGPGAAPAAADQGTMHLRAGDHGQAQGYAQRPHPGTPQQAPHGTVAPRAYPGYAAPQAPYEGQAPYGSPAAHEARAPYGAQAPAQDPAQAPYEPPFTYDQGRPYHRPAPDRAAPEGPHGHAADGYDRGRPYDADSAYDAGRGHDDDRGYDHEPPRRRSRARRWLIGSTVVAVLGIGAWQTMSYYEIPPFTDKGDPVSFDQTPSGGDSGSDSGGTSRAKPADSKTLMPTGPKAAFKVANTLDDGTKIGVVTYDGKKSGFTGKVWVWAPKEYSDPKYAKSGFPVLIALPGGAGYPMNYWMGTDLKLQSSITQWYQEGKSKPFLLAMPVQNPQPDTDGTYWDGSDIPGQPKMGTWLTEDVPELMKENFRTIKSRDGWAFMGSSTGGFNGLKAVLQKPDRFKAVVASGPDVVPDSRLWKGHEKEKQENNPQVLAQRLIDRKGPDVYLAFQVGTNESNPRTLPDVQKFIATYGKGPIHTSLRIIQGGRHNAATYVPNMGEGPIQFISEHMEGPTPSS
ncbi:alpha/beta hydrolase-fold protein [Streptomyces sp. NPDC093225]|uniref:alpha/beta hydrolase-fold protein n=1 Tax=Streptomyces sp. NPDC093225 TaxID=3366034 RepID=UPI0037FB092C